MSADSPPARFDYYRRLSKKDKATYDASDGIAKVALRSIREMRAAAAALEEVLATGDRRATQTAARALVAAITTDLGTENVIVKVLTRRPTSASHELHGLYVREEGADPIIRVWMRTSVHRKVVRPRTFLRTLLHEVLHHLDFALFGLEESFHTQGFYRRESDLVRKVLGPPRSTASRRSGTGARASNEPSGTGPSLPPIAPGPPGRAPEETQLSLFSSGSDNSKTEA